MRKLASELGDQVRFKQADSSTASKIHGISDKATTGSERQRH